MRLFVLGAMMVAAGVPFGAPASADPTPPPSPGYQIPTPAGREFPGAQVYPRVRRLSREHRPKLRLAHHPCSWGQNGTIGHVAYQGGDLERVREERDNSIRELRARGLSIRKIASLLDCKKSTVIQRHSRITRLSGVHACELSQHCCAEGLNGPWR